MLIAHAPVGYLTSRLLARYCTDNASLYRRFIRWGMLGAIAPDIDWLWCVFVDHYETDHHQYFTHLPITWILALLLSSLWVRRNPANGILAMSFCLGGLMHMVLDTFLGGILWFAPFSDQAVVWLKSSADFPVFWWFHSLFRSSLTLELFLMALAGLYWLKPDHRLKQITSI